MWFLFERFPLPLCAWDGLRYFIVALPEPSYNYFGFEGWILVMIASAPDLCIIFPFVYFLLYQVYVSETKYN